FGCAFAVLAFRLAGTRFTARVAAASALAGLGLALALVGVDAAAGGSSHVTRAVRHPLGTVLDLGHRIHISAASFASSWHAALVITVSLAALAALAASPPRFPAGDALLVGIA